MERITSMLKDDISPFRCIHFRKLIKINHENRRKYINHIIISEGVQKLIDTNQNLFIISFRTIRNTRVLSNLINYDNQYI